MTSVAQATTPSGRTNTPAGVEREMIGGERSDGEMK